MRIADEGVQQFRADKYEVRSIRENISAGRRSDQMSCFHFFCSSVLVILLSGSLTRAYQSKGRSVRCSVGRREGTTRCKDVVGFGGTVAVRCRLFPPRE